MVWRLSSVIDSASRRGHDASTHWQFLLLPLGCTYFVREPKPQPQPLGVCPSIWNSHIFAAVWAMLLWYLQNTNLTSGTCSLLHVHGEKREWAGLQIASRYRGRPGGDLTTSRDKWFENKPGMRQDQSLDSRSVVLGLIPVLQKSTAFVLGACRGKAAFAFAFCFLVNSPHRCLWFLLTCLILSVYLGIHWRNYPGLLTC